MSYGCTGTSVVSIWSGFFHVSRTCIKSNLVGFDEDLYKKCTLVGYTSTSIDLPTCTAIDQIHSILPLHGCYNSLLSVSPTSEYGVYVHDFPKRCDGKQNIHYGYQIIPVKLNKYLMYVPMQEPTY